MLPGFRFLFAATLLTLSLVVFGLGAAALLRASHDRFASLPIRPLTGPALATVPEAAMPTLSLLRVEPADPEPRVVPEPAAARAPVDTLMPNDRVATFIVAPRVEDVPLTQPMVAEPKKETKPEPKIEQKPEPPKVEAKIETMPESAVEVAAKPSVADAAAAVAPPAPVQPEPVVSPKPDDVAKAETPTISPQQIAALAEPETTAAIPDQASIDPSLINARPIRKPPVPRNRPVDADVVAALPEPAIVIPAPPEAAKPVLRRRRAVVRRVVRPRRSVIRPATTQNSGSLFGT